MHARAGVEVVRPRRREQPRLADGSHEPALVRQQVVGVQDRRQQQAADAGRQDDQAEEPPAGRVAHPAGRGGPRKRPCRENERVDGGQRLEGDGHGEQQRVAHARPGRDAIEREDGQRQELQVHRLQVGQAREHVRVEGRQRPRHECRPELAGQAEHEQAGCEGRQHEPGQQHQVVREHRRSAQGENRLRQHPLDDERLGVREGQTRGVEDRRVEQLPGVAGERVGHPRDRPRVQVGVGRVETGVVAGGERERPRVEHRQQHESR